MSMTFDQYITNPLGKNNAVLSAITREGIRKNYSERFDNILLRENGKINYYLYKTKDNQFIIHIKIPSEPVKNFYYDVVLKFHADESITNAGNVLSNYYFQAFSNDPAFVYTHAYVFKQHDLFIKLLSDKMGKKPLTKEPEVKNPDKQLAYVKSIYFAYLFMKNRGLFKKISWSAAEDFKEHKQEFLDRIMPVDKKIALREEEEKKLDHRKKILVDNKTAKQLSHMKNLSDEAKSRLITTTKKTPKVKRTKAVNLIKKSNVIGKKI